MSIPIPETCEENAQLQTKILLDQLYEQRQQSKILGVKPNPSPYVSL